MNDYARGFFMEIQRILESGEKKYICTSLIKAIAGSLGNSDIMDIFPEFYALRDEYFWRKNGTRIFIGNRKKVAWWEKENKDARIRFLNFLLNR